jgi:hypothetical protein
MATPARATTELIGCAGGKPFCVATRCADIDEFIAKFHANCDETSIFVATTDSRAIGHASPFMIMLADKTPVMRGTCTVLEAWRDGDNPFGRPGIRIALDQLTDSSREILDRMLVARGSEPLIKTPAKPQHRSATMIGFPVVRVPSNVLDAGPQPVQDPPTERMSMPPAGVIELGLTRPLPPLPRRPSPIEINVESSSSVKRTKGMRVATPCTSVEKFIEVFHRCCEPESFFIATKSARPIGLESAFSIDLADGRPMLRGYCTVLEAWQTGANRFKRPGVLIGLKQLTADSRVLFDRLLAAGKAAEDANEAKPVVLVDRMTRPMAAIPTTHFAVPVIKPLAKPRTITPLHPPTRVAAATPVAPTPVAPPPRAVEDKAQAVAEAPPLPEPASTVSESMPASIPDPMPLVEHVLDVAPVIPPLPDEHEAVSAPAPAAMSFDSVPSAEWSTPVSPITAPIAAPVAVPVDHSTSAEVPSAEAIVIAKPRSRWLAFATLVVGLALGAVVGYMAQPAATPTLIVITALAPSAPAPIAKQPTPVPVAAPAAPTVAPHPTPPPPAVRAPAVTRASVTKRSPMKRVVRSMPNRAPACTSLSCL